MLRASREGRAEFRPRQFRVWRPEPMQARLAIRTIERHSNGASSTGTNARRMRPIYRLHHDLLDCGRTDGGIPRQPRAPSMAPSSGPLAFVLHLRAAGQPTAAAGGEPWKDLVASSFAEPLVALRMGTDWTIRMSTNSRSTGDGTPPVVTGRRWRIPGQAAIVLAANAKQPPPSSARGLADLQQREDFLMTVRSALTLNWSDADVAGRRKKAGSHHVEGMVVTNGLAGTVGHHFGLLDAALPTPAGCGAATRRQDVMSTTSGKQLRCPTVASSRSRLSPHLRGKRVRQHAVPPGFWLEEIAVWHTRSKAWQIEKRVLMCHLQTRRTSTTACCRQVHTPRAPAHGGRSVPRGAVSHPIQATVSLHALATGSRLFRETICRAPPLLYRPDKAK